MEKEGGMGGYAFQMIRNKGLVQDRTGGGREGRKEGGEEVRPVDASRLRVKRKRIHERGKCLRERHGLRGGSLKKYVSP